MSSDAQIADAVAAAHPTPMEPLLRLVNKLQEACALAGDVADTDASGKASKLPSLWETLPQIVVVGGQSSGKSSVLESIVGRDFLPRGAGICTRRPLVLQLHGAPASEVASARFLHKPKTVFTDFHEVRAEIERETDRSLQSKGSKAVSAEPIMLSIRAANAPSLTLVDMPGLTKVATADQPASVVADIERMAKKFIVSENVVIVAVSAANADIATSDGVRLAKEVDPRSERTLGVLTKLDLMDKGTDATDVLNGKAVHLALGWCAVVNRSQDDIQRGVDMRTARENERVWFETHGETYGTEQASVDGSRAFAKDPDTTAPNVGTDALVNALVRVLGERVRREIPRIRETVETSARDLELELAGLGPATPHFEDRGALVHEVLRGCDAYERAFADELDAASSARASAPAAAARRFARSSRRRSTRTFARWTSRRSTTRSACARSWTRRTGSSRTWSRRRWAYAGSSSSASSVYARRSKPASTASTPCCGAPRDRRSENTKNSRIPRDNEASLGSLPAMFSRPAAFRTRVSYDAVSSSDASTFSSRFESSSPLRRYPRLREAVVGAAGDALRRLRRDASAMTSAMVDMEAAYFDAEFFRRLQTQQARNGAGGAAAAGDASSRRAARPPEGERDEASGGGDVFGASPTEPSDFESSRLRTIASSVRAYVDAVRARLAKTVPKAIVFKQVAKARRGVLAEFANDVGRVDDAELRRWMEEDPAVSRRRAACRERLTLLDKAREEIGAVMGELAARE
jgi:GTPase SAR1 family protein